MKNENSQDFWVEEDDVWICNPCLFNSKSKNVPKKLLPGRSGTFGFVSKSAANKITRNKSRHIESKLHEWCVYESQKESETKSLNDRRNEIAGTKIVRNALLCFIRGYGSDDFLLMNLKDYLAEKDLGSKLYNIATKNDSKIQFFRQRNVIFEALTAKTKNLFKDIRDIAVTLDKVTVQRSSYTVIMTYFFRDGKKLNLK